MQILYYHRKKYWFFICWCSSFRSQVKNHFLKRTLPCNLILNFVILTFHLLRVIFLCTFMFSIHIAWTLRIYLLSCIVSSISMSLRLSHFHLGISCASNNVSHILGVPEIIFKLIHTLKKNFIKLCKNSSDHCYSLKTIDL